MVEPIFSWPAKIAAAAGGEAVTHLRTIVGGMSKSTGRRPFRTLLLIAAIVGAALAVRAAIADKGGVYDPAAVKR